MGAFWLNLDQISILPSTNPWLKMFINNLRVKKGFIQLKNLYSLQPVKPRGYENSEIDVWMAGWTDGWVSGWIRMSTVSNHTENSECALRQPSNVQHIPEPWKASSSFPILPPLRNLPLTPGICHALPMVVFWIFQE